MKSKQLLEKEKREQERFELISTFINFVVTIVWTIGILIFLIILISALLKGNLFIK